MIVRIFYMVSDLQFLGLLQMFCIAAIVYFIKWSLKKEPFEDLYKWRLQKDVGHLAWSDEFNGHLIHNNDFKRLNELAIMRDTLGNPDFPRIELSEVSTRLWTPLYMRGGTDWMARKLTLWERLKLVFWKLRFYWRFRKDTF